MPGIDIDNTARDRIRNELSSSFFVSAGAGSGKTTMLVDRMVRMVEEGVDISKICTITFTKAAAAEFYTRFQKKLSESEDPRTKKALENIDLCFMGTIDSFCNMILSEHPVEAKIPPSSQVVTDEEMSRLYMREFSRIRRGELGDDLKKKCELFSSCFYAPGEAFMCGMEFLSASRSAGFVKLPIPSKKPDELFAQRRERLIGILKYISEHEEIVPSDKAKEVLEALNALREGREKLFGSWNDDISAVLRILGSVKKLRIVKEFGPRLDELGPGWEDIIKPHCSRSSVSWYEIDPDPDADPLLIRALSEYCMAAAFDLFSAAYPSVSAQLRSEGKLSFSDYLFYLRDLLKEDAASGGKLIRHIRQRHDRFLIDEFQDTDPVQTEIFFYLSTDDPDPDWKKCVPAPGSLFIVGDSKQSIYRFKNADVSSFIRTEKRFSDPSVGESLMLTRNYRSVAELKRWFNKAFSSLLPADSDISSRFEEIPLDDGSESAGERSGSPQAALPSGMKLLEGVFSYSVISSRSKESRTDHIKVSELIRRITDDPGIVIVCRDKGGAVSYRHPGYRDFMVITPGKSSLSSYMEAMRAGRIPFRVEGKTTFSECPALKSVSRILSAAADPFDKKAVFAAMSLSGCALDESRLFSYYEDSKSLTPSALFSRIMDEERVFARAGSLNAEYAYFALELLREAELEEGITTAKEAAEFIEGLLVDPEQERCLQLVRDADVVRLANLHKVKGLEAPIVILADPYPVSSRRPQKRIDLMSDPPAAYLFEIKTSRFGGLRTAAFGPQEELESEADAAEKLRLLYVAATRAMNALVISSASTSKGELANGYWVPLLEFGSRYIDAEPGLSSTDEAASQSGGAPSGPEAESERPDPQELYDEAESAYAAARSGSVRPSYSVMRPSTVLLKGTSAEDEAEDEADAHSTQDTPMPARPRGFDATLAGTLAHRIMESVVSSRNRFDAGVLIKAVLGEFAADEGLYGPLLRKMLETVLSGGFEQFNGVPRDILGELLSADEVYCELPFCCSDGGTELWHGVMDAVYLKDGQWHIIDYKTSADPADLDGRYEAQLTSYVRAFREMTGEEADARIYHLEI